MTVTTSTRADSRTLGGAFVQTPVSEGSAAFTVVGARHNNPCQVALKSPAVWRPPVEVEAKIASERAATSVMRLLTIWRSGSMPSSAGCLPRSSPPVR
jgi:hypothetical protein